MGRLLGDPEVWDDSPARPRPAVRGLAGLAAGAVAGLLLAFAVVPRPDPPPPEVRLAPSAEAPRLRVEKQLLYSASIGGGPMLVSRSGRLEQVNADGTERRVVAQNLRASAVVGPDRAGVLAAVDSGVVTRVEANGTTRRLRAAAAAAGRWLALLGLADRADQRTDQLSGGERQRVALARALAVEPDVLLVDEPTAELEEDNRGRAVGLLRDAADRGAAVVVATHDPEVVKLCDRVVRLVDGRPVELDPDS
ncbi:MAG: ATP-binding cassette domain-containing protein, partial [Actinomycetes bacterium]